MDNYNNTVYNNFDSTYGSNDNLAPIVHDMKADNLYLTSLMNPSMVHSKMPMVQNVPTVDKVINLSLSIQTDNTATQYGIMHFPHIDDPSVSVQIGRYNGGQWYWQSPPPSWSEDLAENFTNYRLVSGEVISYSNTISPGVLTLSGSANATSFDVLPDVSAVTYESLIGYTRNNSSIRKGVPAADGVVMQARPITNTVLRPIRNKQINNIASEHVAYYSFINYPLMFPAATSSTTLFAVEFQDSVNDQKIANAFCKIQVDFTILTANSAGTANCTVQLIGNVYTAGGVYTTGPIATADVGFTLNGTDKMYTGSVLLSPTTIPTGVRIVAPVATTWGGTSRTCQFVKLTFLGHEDDGLVYPASMTIWKGLGNNQQLVIQGTHNYELVANPQISKQIKATYNDAPFRDFEAAQGVLFALMKKGFDNIFTKMEHQDLIKKFYRVFTREVSHQFATASPFLTAAYNFLSPVVKSASKHLIGQACERLKDIGYATPFEETATILGDDVIVDKEEEKDEPSTVPKLERENSSNTHHPKGLSMLENFSYLCFLANKKREAEKLSYKRRSKHPLAGQCGGEDQYQIALEMDLLPLRQDGFCYLQALALHYGGSYEDTRAHECSVITLKRKVKELSQNQPTPTRVAIADICHYPADACPATEFINLVGQKVVSIKEVYRLGYVPNVQFLLEYIESEPAHLWLNPQYDPNKGLAKITPEELEWIEDKQSTIDDVPVILTQSSVAGINLGASIGAGLFRKNQEILEERKKATTPSKPNTSYTIPEKQSMLYRDVSFLTGKDPNKGYKTDEIVKGRRPVCSGVGFQSFPYVKTVDSVKIAKIGQLAFTLEPVDYYPRTAGPGYANEPVKYHDPLECYGYMTQHTFQVFISDNVVSTKEHRTAEGICGALAWINNKDIKQLYITAITDGKVAGISLTGSVLYFAVGGFDHIFISMGVMPADDKDVGYGPVLLPIGDIMEKFTLTDKDHPLVTYLPRSMAETAEKIAAASFGAKKTVHLPGMDFAGVTEADLYICDHYINFFNYCDFIGRRIQLKYGSDIRVPEREAAVNLHSVRTRGRDHSYDRGSKRMGDDLDEEDWDAYFSLPGAQQMLRQYAALKEGNYVPPNSITAIENYKAAQLNNNYPIEFWPLPTNMKQDVPIDTILDIILRSDESDEYLRGMVDQLYPLSKNRYMRREINKINQTMNSDYPRLMKEIAADYGIAKRGESREPQRSSRSKAPTLTARRYGERSQSREVKAPVQSAGLRTSRKASIEERVTKPVGKAKVGLDEVLGDSDY